MKRLLDTKLPIINKKILRKPIQSLKHALKSRKKTRTLANTHSNNSFGDRTRQSKQTTRSYNRRRNISCGHTPKVENDCTPLPPIQRVRD
jgi:hypothetical protein